MSKKKSKTAKKKAGKLKKIVATGAAAATLGLGFWASKAVYSVKEVVDGDTFITTENQYVRLDSVDAPELEYCLGEEAKEELEKLVLNKKVFIKVSYLNGMRLVASVYTSQGDVGAKMLSKGLATFADKGHQKQSTLLKISQEAREKKIGVYSATCTQMENPINPSCDIKGNIRNGVWYYRYPTCTNYKNTQVQLYLGEDWFCTEAEAKKAGYIKAPDCP